MKSALHHAEPRDVLRRAARALTRGAAHRSAPAVIVALALLLCLPAAFSGFYADDFIHRVRASAELQLPGFPTSQWDLFNFATPETTGTLRDSGMLAWWADPELRVAFFRPVAAISHVLDARLGLGAFGSHLHSLLWFGACLWAMWLLFCEVQATRLGAVLALFFYAVDPTRAAAVGWVANRNALISLALGTLALLVHLRSLRERGKGHWASPLLLLLAMLSGEGASGVAGYLLGAALFFDPRPRLRALLALVPHGAVTLGVLLLSQALGYGADHSAGYLDPRHQPLDYLAALPERMLALLTAAWGGLASDSFEIFPLISPKLPPIMYAVGCAFLLFWAAALPAGLLAERSSRFLLLGMGVAVIPATAAAASDRLLTFVAIGVAGLLGRVIEQALTARSQLPRRTQWALPTILLIHAVIAPINLAAQSQNLVRVAKTFSAAEEAIPEGVGDDESVLFLNPPQTPQTTFIAPRRVVLGKSMPRIRALAPGMTPVAVTRVAENRIVVEQESGLLSNHTEQLTRDILTHPFAVGDRVDLADLKVEVLEVTADGRPLRVSVEFTRALPHVVAYRAGHYESVALPSLGTCEEFDGGGFLTMLLGENHVLTRWLEGGHSRAPLCAPAGDDAVAEFTARL